MYTEESLKLFKKDIIGAKVSDVLYDVKRNCYTLKCRDKELSFRLMRDIENDGFAYSPQKKEQQKKYEYRSEFISDREKEGKVLKSGGEQGWILCNRYEFTGGDYMLTFYREF